MDKTEATKLIALRHPEWTEHQLRWRWLLDSLEGGERYRQAVYGVDRHGLPIRNLLRHKREYPDPRDLPGTSGQIGSATYLGGIADGMAGGMTGPAVAMDQAQFASDDDYEMRRARTPVPTFVPEAAGEYTSRIFASEVDRDAPKGPDYDRLRDWWKDVNGRGVSIDEWMADMIGDLLLALGRVDIAFDHPPAPVGKTIESEYDADEAGVKRCVASFILPQNLVWWDWDESGCRYSKALVQEYAPGEEQIAGTGLGPGAATIMPNIRYRYWTAEGSQQIAQDGTPGPYVPHNFGVVPIHPVYDKVKPRCRNVGQPRLEAIAERQREYYNRDSELILSDTLQAHPLLQGPEAYCDADATVPIGPGYLLPMKREAQGTSVTYQGFEAIDFPKGAAESLRQNKQDIRDDVDRDAKLTKPAGAKGSGKTSVGQSGVSKQLDHEGLHRVLSAVAKVFAKAEKAMAHMALTVLFDGKPPLDACDKVKIAYPSVFNLYAADELAQITTDFQAILGQAGDAPETESTLLSEIVRKALPGRDDETYERLDDEIAEAVKAKATRKEQANESAPMSAVGPDGTPPVPPPKPGTAKPTPADTDVEDTPESGA